MTAATAPSGSPVPRGWPPGSPRVLVTDAWLPNAGDAAIALATQQLVGALAPGAAVLHAAHGAAEVGHHYPELDLVPPLARLLGTRWAPPAPGWAHEGPALVGAADLVVSQGGGFLREGYEPWSRLDALARVAEARPLVLLGQTIGRFGRAFARRDLGRVLRHAARVVVRDPRSAWHAVELGAPPGVVELGADTALFLVDPPDDASTAPDGPRGPVGVVLSAEVVPGEEARRGALATELLRVVAAARPGDRLEVWSSAQGTDTEVDHLAATAAHDALDPADRDRVALVEGHVPAGGLVERSGRAPLLVSMRFHPALLAAARGVPAVVVTDPQKAAAFQGTPMAGRAVVSGPDAPARVAALLAGPAPQDPAGARFRAALAERLAVTRAALAEALAGAAAGTTPGPDDGSGPRIGPGSGPFGPLSA
ncbi:MAG: polysaccharide pyruvyl transferase family protein [Acidimicrobiia bacterium]